MFPHTLKDCFVPYQGHWCYVCSEKFQSLLIYIYCSLSRKSLEFQPLFHVRFACGMLNPLCLRVYVWYWISSHTSKKNGKKKLVCIYTFKQYMRVQYVFHCLHKQYHFSGAIWPWPTSYKKNRLCLIWNCVFTTLPWNESVSSYVREEMKSRNYCYHVNIYLQ